MNKLSVFNTLHQQDDIFILPNAWDVLSAMVLEQTGFKAVATTSWGVSNSFGYKDGEQVDFDDLLSLAAKMVAAVTIPVSVDIEAGYASDPETIAENALKIAKVGAAGINIEDSSKSVQGLVDIHAHCDLISKIRNRLDENGFKGFFINARTDTSFQSKPFEETLERAINYVAHGANGIFVPGLSDTDQIKQLVETVPAPINIMSLPSLMDAKSLQELGVKRFSIGNALSDATTVFIEKQAQKLLASASTAHLYGDTAVLTSFR